RRSEDDGRSRVRRGTTRAPCRARFCRELERPRHFDDVASQRRESALPGHRHECALLRASACVCVCPFLVVLLWLMMMMMLLLLLCCVLFQCCVLVVCVFVGN